MLLNVDEVQNWENRRFLDLSLQCPSPASSLNFLSPSLSPARRPIASLQARPTRLNISLPSIAAPARSTALLTSPASSNTRPTRNGQSQHPSRSHVAPDPLVRRGGASFQAISPSLLLHPTRPDCRRSRPAEFAPCREDRHEGETDRCRLWWVFSLWS